MLGTKLRMIQPSSGEDLIKGALYSWGRNGHGRTGLGTDEGNSLEPTQPDHEESWTDIVSCSHWSLGILDGKLYAWGWNASGRTGLNISTNTNTLVPTQVGVGTEYETGWTQISGYSTHSIGICDGKIYAWGVNVGGATGQGITSGNTLVPTQIGTESDWDMVSAGHGTSLGLRSGMLYSWGLNHLGGSGLGLTSGNTLVPTLVDSEGGWSHIDCGKFLACAIRGGDLYTWGYNFYGQLGDGTRQDKSTPTLIGTGWTTVSPGEEHIMGIKDGKLYGWGRNWHGRTGLGITNNTNTLEPTQVGVGTEYETGWTQTSAALMHSLGIRRNKLYAWGTNGNGQLGDGTLEGRGVPTLINDSKSWKFASAGDQYSMAIAL